MRKRAAPGRFTVTSIRGDARFPSRLRQFAKHKEAWVGDLLRDAFETVYGPEFASFFEDGGRTNDQPQRVK